MDADRWSRVKELFHQAAEVAPADRPAFLKVVCGDDAGLRGEVELLLASDAAEGFLEAVVAEAAQSLAAAADDESQLTGKHIGAYQITGLIGKGGMGAVYRAVRTEDFRMPVAIKLLKRGVDTDTALSRFRKERQILAGLDHPNIARLYDGGATDAGMPYFAMEYVDGLPLLEYAAPLSVRQRLELFRRVCAAVQYAHEHGVLHRDIKPANILVSREGIPKLLDFGIAKLVAGPDEPTTAGTPTAAHLMTPEYASPEQLRREPLTTATDIYSLGTVLYELLTNERACQGQVRGEEAPQTEPVTGGLKRLRALRRIDPELEKIVLMAMREEPHRRYVTVEEFSRDLNRFLQDLPVQAKQDGWLYRCRKFVKRNRRVTVAAVFSAASVLALMGALRRLETPNHLAETEIRSIAVLPLENLSGDREQEYFADGMTDALISDLARIRALRVISRTSTISYKGTRRPLPEIARSLGVGMIAEGSVLRAGNRVRITIRLVDAVRERSIWSGNYEGELRDVLALQSRVADAIAGEIRVTLTAPERVRMSRSRRVDLDAYDAYLKGRRHYLTEFNHDSIRKAMAYFQQALTLDPEYAPAYMGLADCYYMASNMYYPPNEMMPKARAAAMKALELDDTLGEALGTLAMVRSVYEFKHAEAEAAFRRALELNPSDAQAHVFFSLHLTNMGRFDEALAEVQQAQKLDPVSPAMNAYLVGPLLYAHRPDRIIQHLQPFVEMHPNYNQLHAGLAAAYAQLGNWGKAIPAMEKANELDVNQDGLAQLGHMYALSGRTADARRVLRELKELSRKRYVSAYNFALLHVGLGEKDEAFRWLQRVEEDRSEWFAGVKVDPRFDSLHSDPRFAGVLRSVGFAP